MKLVRRVAALAVFATLFAAVGVAATGPDAARALSRQAPPPVAVVAPLLVDPAMVVGVPDSGPLAAAAVAAKRWWVAPVAGATRCSSPFNQLRTDNGTYRHAGRDLLRYEGAPVRAVANGTVVRVTAPSGYKGGYGYRVQIRHGKGQYETLLAHLQRGSITVHVGQWVRMGTVIGRMGHTGWAYGTHTHFEVRSWGTPINPDRFMLTRGVRIC